MINFEPLSTSELEMVEGGNAFWQVVKTIVEVAYTIYSVYETGKDHLEDRGYKDGYEAARNSYLVKA